MKEGDIKRAAGRRGYLNLKRAVLLHYTPVEESGRHVPKCADCPEEDLVVLTLHHTLGNGKDDRVGYGWGSELFRSLQARGYPEGFAVLCANCSLKRHKKPK